MQTKEYKTDLGIIKIEEKENKSDREIFVGAIRLKFIPKLPIKNNVELKVFSCSLPEHTRDGSYEYLMSWYKDGRNINNELIGDY